MAFFGLTTFGNSNPIADVSARGQSYQFHVIPDEAYVAAFNKYLLGNSGLALQLQVDGTETILRKHLGDILTDVLGHNPTKSELSAWFTFVDFDGSATLSLSEFQSSLEKLKTFSEQPMEPKQYKSYCDLHTNWHRHRRVDYDPQHTLKGPISTAQEVGWHCAKPLHLQHGREFRPLSQTDVTLREGRNATHYYGHFVCP